MKILFVTHYNPFEVLARSFRVRELASRLTERGHQVDIMIGSEDRILFSFDRNTPLFFK